MIIHRSHPDKLPFIVCSENKARVREMHAAKGWKE